MDQSSSPVSLEWSKYLQIGAYDCASESLSSNDICQDELYPQWRIFCPLTNSTHLVLGPQQDPNDLTLEAILIIAIEKLNRMAEECYGTSWPVQPMIP